jgi:hypothetical protein
VDKVDGKRGEGGRLEKRRDKREEQLHLNFNVNGGKKLGGEWERDA